jgi:hypothetical protein
VRLESTQGLEALGGGSFEEVVRPPLGNCSINTHADDVNVYVRYPLSPPQKIDRVVPNSRSYPLKPSLPFPDLFPTAPHPNFPS